MNKNFLNRKFTINEYQRPIIIISIVPLLTVCALLTVLSVTFFREFENFIVYKDIMTLPDFLQKWMMIIIVALWSFFLVNLLIVYNVSSNLVGSFKRILRELDAILKENKRTKINCRKNDILARDMILRINQLIEKLPGSQK